MKQNQPKQKYKKIIKNNQKWNDVVLESWRQWRVGWLVGWWCTGGGNWQQEQDGYTIVPSLVLWWEPAVMVGRTQVQMMPS